MTRPSPTQIRVAILSLALGISLFVRSQVQLQVGYSLLTADPGTTLPIASALFTYTNSKGVLVSQAGVAATESIFSGRIFVDEVGTQTGIALVNPSQQIASITLTLRDVSGKEVDRKTQSLGAGKHLATYVYQLFGNLASGFTGSLTFESDQKLAAITLRESRNAQGEPLYTTLPVVDLALPANHERLVFPQIAAGEGYTTQLVLINSTTQKLTGQITLTGSDGKPLSLRLKETVASEFSYQIDPQGTYRAEFDNPSALATGYALVTPDSGSSSPSGSAIFQFKQNNALVTEAGVAATNTTTSARIFVDNVGSYTGVALANPDNQSAVVTFTLLDRYGSSLDSTTRTLVAKGHLAIFAHELFPSLTDKSTGLMDISSASSVAPITLKLTINDRGEQVLTTLPVADLNKLPTATSVVFPQIAIGEGFSTWLILINVSKTKIATGKMSFYQSDASAMTLPLGGKTDSQFNYEVTAGGGRQFLPGNTAKIASISLLDPSSSEITKEVAVNEGKSLRAKMLVLDTTGTARDDFDLIYTSLSRDVATVDTTGNIQGKAAGFSTLTIESGGVVAAGTITVVKVDSGTTGYEITGIAQDLARRLYLANTNDHTILLAQDLKQTPAVYAGIAKTSGLKNDERLKSLFKSPAFLAFNQAEGSLYVSDGANHVIRKVQSGPTGKVETLAGTGKIGSKDGSIKEATFNNPQGVALDNRGNLWAVDSGNNTIRRINLVKGTVETIAGKAGSEGWVDSTGENARFSSPIGIAVETESLAKQLEREKKGDPPPPITMIVADTGNRVIRRVKETGEVETIRATGQKAPSATRSGTPEVESAVAAAVSFSSPTGIAVDSAGSIYVTETKSARVRAILGNGDVVSAAQTNTLTTPKGIVITQNGKLVVADGMDSAREISYGEPHITSITPDHVSTKGGERVSILGSNFAPETVVIIAGVVISGAQVKDTQTISFTAPPLPSGLATVSVQNRGGLHQKSLLVDAVPLSSTSPGNITTVAGGTTFVGDGGDARSAGLTDPYGIAMDAEGNLFIADTFNNRVRKIVSKSGTITTVAGTGAGGFSGDNGPATAAQLDFPWRIVVDKAGNLFIADTLNNRIRKVDAGTGIITTVAGSSGKGFSGDNGPATGAQLYYPEGIAIDDGGNLFIADTYNQRIRKVAASTGLISTVAGNGKGDSYSCCPRATEASLSYPSAVALDTSGNLFIADTYQYHVLLINGEYTTVTGIIREVVAATGIITGIALGSNFNHPFAIAVDAAGNVFVADTWNHQIRKLAASPDMENAVASTVAGTGEGGFSGDNGRATSASLYYPTAITLDASGNLFIADSNNSRIRKVATATSVITTLAGNGRDDYLGDGGPATSAQLVFPWGLGRDIAGNIFIADTDHNRIRKVASGTGLITTVAGNGTFGFSGDNGSATTARLAYPRGIAIDSGGNLFIADTQNNRIRKVTKSTGIITTVAGNGRFDYIDFTDDNRVATAAGLARPSGIAIDNDGNLFIADTGNHRIRKVAASTGIISTVAGQVGKTLFLDNRLATDATLSSPYGIAIDAAGNLFIADAGNNRIRKVDAGTGIITTVAGYSEQGFAGDNDLAIDARLYSPFGIVLDTAGNLFIADAGNNRIRKVAAKTGIINTVAGNSLGLFSGDNGPAVSAGIDVRGGIALDLRGNLLISDSNNGRIRAVRTN